MIYFHQKMITLRSYFIIPRCLGDLPPGQEGWLRLHILLWWDSVPEGNMKAENTNFLT